MPRWHTCSTTMKGQVFLSLLAVVTASKIRQDVRVSKSLVVDSQSHLSVPAASFEDTYLMLSSAAVMSEQEVEDHLVSTMEKTTSDAALSNTGSVEMELLGVTGAMMGLNQRGNSSGPGVPEPTRKKFVSSMKPLIDKLQDQIHDAHAPSQDRLDDAIHAFQNCNWTLQTALAALKVMDATVASQRAAHRQCRLQEDAAFNAWRSCDKTSVYHVPRGNTPPHHLDECAVWPSLKLTNPVVAGQKCLQMVPGESYETYLQRMQAHWTHELAEYMRLKALCDHTTTLTTTLPDGCPGKKVVWQNKKRECDLLQTRFEQGYCVRAQKVTSAWDAYVECYNCANTSYSQAVITEKQQMLSRKAELRASKRIDCLLKVFTEADGRKAIEECRDKTHSTDSISIDIHKVPQRMPVPPHPPLPGTPGFYQVEYASFPKNAPAQSQLVSCMMVTAR